MTDPDRSELEIFNEKIIEHHFNLGDHIELRELIVLCSEQPYTPDEVAFLVSNWGSIIRLHLLGTTSRKP